MVAMPESVRVPLHPGEILADAIRERGTTAYKLAKATGLSQVTISQILKRNRTITASTALLFGRYFATSPEFWLNLQAAYDLDVARVEIADALAAVVPLPLPEGHDGTV
jgi:addiction module HigA family antidote